VARALAGGLLLLLFLLQEGVDGRRQFVEALLEFLQLVDCVVMVVAALTGRLGLLSTTWLARMPAAARQREGLLGVVAQRFADLRVERRVVVVEVPEQVLQARPGHGSSS
jgi:hypothetical protein